MFCEELVLGGLKASPLMNEFNSAYCSDSVGLKCVHTSQSRAGEGDIQL